VSAFFFESPKTIEELLAEPPQPRIHTLSLQDYACLGGRNEDGTPVLHEVTGGDVEAMKRMASRARKVHARFLAGEIDMVQMPSPEPGLRFFIDRASHYVLMTSDDMEALYGCRGSWHMVFEEFRGQGLGKFIHLAMDGYIDRFGGKHTTLSQEGYGCRLAAHREAVIRAHEEGLDDIHPENLERYADYLPSAPMIGGP
jgi:hypothetical protein